MRRALIGLIASGALAASTTVGAQSLGDRFKQFMGSVDGGNANSSAQQLPESEVVSGLRAALADGASAAVTQLGQNDGFWGDAARRIPLPGWMGKTSGVLRGAGFGDQMDSFQLSMNRAAEQATAEAGPIVRETINSMSVRDAYDILQGSDTAATEYLRDKAGDDLAAKFEPIIANTTAQSQAVSRYESLTSKAKPMLQFVPGMNLDVNDYVTQQALDGLFAVIGQQEQKIRANPAATGSAIVKKVFSTVSR
ncbi:hypothetical protein SADO_05715 [Salinisphaera dokdonensis CL-ES53]|uniref:DUF4197 domain-containing protein n=1 Tax=Salinisphaera dokdonensis CL-ES53 TaxID=1304272 RepID=A0ABV2AYM1_9GAMM